MRSFTPPSWVMVPGWKAIHSRNSSSSTLICGSFMGAGYVSPRPAPGLVSGLVQAVRPHTSTSAQHAALRMMANDDERALLLLLRVIVVMSVILRRSQQSEAV